MRRWTVLVVDADGTSRARIVGAVERIDGARAVVAADGHEAIEVYREEEPDLVLIEAQLPGLDGFGVLAWLKSGRRTRRIPVVVVTGAGPAVARMMLDRGCDRCLLKPLDDERLDVLLRGYLVDGA